MPYVADTPKHLLTTRPFPVTSDGADRPPAVLVTAIMAGLIAQATSRQLRLLLHDILGPRFKAICPFLHFGLRHCPREYDGNLKKVIAPFSFAPRITRLSPYRAR